MSEISTPEYENLVELCEVSCRKFAHKPAMGTKRQGRWEWTTYRDFEELVDAFRGGLASLGVGAGDRVGIVSNNRVEWAVITYATYGLGAALVPMYQSQRHDELKFILGDCGAKVVIAANRSLTSALLNMQPDLPALRHVVSLEGSAAEPGSYQALLAAGRAAPVPSRHPDPDSVAGFIYTSGTTGKPKGAMLSHRNLTFIVAASSLFPVGPEDSSLSILPWAHVYGQVCELHIGLCHGSSTAFNDDPSRIIENLAEVKPTFLVAVPLIFNRIYAGVRKQIAGKPAFVRALFRAGIRTAKKKRAGEPLRPLESLELAAADKLIFAKIRARFGGRLKYAISGSAALSREVAEFIDALGIEVYEGYGLTEASPGVSMNLPGARKFGSTGRVLPGVRVVIDRSVSNDSDSGEIVVYGPNVMLGYHHRPEENEKTLQPDGGLRTGDLGRLDADGFLYITGRVKEQYKLENGKYVMPSVLEEQLKLSPYIANAMLFGANKPYNVAIVVPDIDAVRAWARHDRVDLPTDVARSDAVRSLIQAEIERASSNFRGFERPRAFLLTLEDFTVENGQLTPTLKLKRAQLVETYKRELEALYAGEPLPAPLTPSQQSIP